jgi:hypothetical protein
MAVRRRVFAPAFKAKVVAEVEAEMAANADLSEYQASARVGDRWQIVTTVVRSWLANAHGEPSSKVPKMYRKTGTGAVYEPEYKAAAVTELRAAMVDAQPGAVAQVWQKVAAHYAIHVTTLRSWARSVAGAPAIDPATGKRSRAVPSADKRLGPKPPKPKPEPTPPSLPATVSGSHEMTHEMRPDPHIGGDPENALKWNILGAQSDANRYLAHRIDELETKVRLLEAEKMVLMQAMGLVNNHKVIVPG